MKQTVVIRVRVWFAACMGWNVSSSINRIQNFFLTVWTSALPCLDNVMINAVKYSIRKHSATWIDKAPAIFWEFNSSGKGLILHGVVIARLHIFPGPKHGNAMNAASLQWWLWCWTWHHLRAVLPCTCFCASAVCMRVSLLCLLCVKSGYHCLRVILVVVESNAYRVIESMAFQAFVTPNSQKSAAEESSALKECPPPYSPATL